MDDFAHENQIGGMQLSTFFSNENANDLSSQLPPKSIKDGKCPNCWGKSFVFNPFFQGIPQGESVCITCGYSEYTDLSTDE